MSEFRTVVAVIIMILCGVAGLSKTVNLVRGSTKTLSDN